MSIYKSGSLESEESRIIALGLVARQNLHALPLTLLAPPKFLIMIKRNKDAYIFT
jgi:hypothetical protein